MMRLSDAVVLAHTKLRTHKVRTGITIGAAGILFGLIFGGVFVAQGIFDSVERFNDEGLASRSIVAVSKLDSTSYFNAYDHSEDSTFIAEVKQAHEERVALKTAAAQKYGIDYEPRIEDPSPIEVDEGSGKERISDDALSSELVRRLASKRTNELRTPLDIEAYLEPYRTAKVIEDSFFVRPPSGTILPMIDGKEMSPEDEREQFRYRVGGVDAPTIQVLDDSLTAPFVLQKGDQVPEGELPGVVSFSYAESLLGLEPLAKSSSNQEKLARLHEVRERVGEISASFCYRNAASQSLLAQAALQQQQIERGKDMPGYTKPSLIYALSGDDSCGAVTVASDTRTEAEKQADANLEAYQKEIGTHPGDPEQHKITLRAIGLSGDAPGQYMSGTAGDVVMSLLGSWLHYGAAWSIPAGLLAEAPEHSRPAALFDPEEIDATNALFDFSVFDSYMVEFGDEDEARAAVEGSTMGSDGVNAMPFGSGVLVVDQLRSWFATGLLWALAVVGGVALIVLAGLIGRMVSDGRRESAVFRAIGARRSDIGSIYGMYALLLSLRVAFFALVLGLLAALAVEVWLSADATVGARLAYAAADTDKSFHFIGLGSWYIPAILGVIVAAGLLASIVPILLGARRNPINDMRDDT